MVRNCLLANNLNGGVIVTGSGTVDNCTIVANTCVPDPYVTNSSSVGGIDLEQIVEPSVCFLQNNIVCNNSSNQVSPEISNDSIRFNCIQTGRILWMAISLRARVRECN